MDDEPLTREQLEAVESLNGEGIVEPDVTPEEIRTLAE